MDEYSLDENHLEQNLQSSKNSKKVKKARKHKSNNDNLTNSSEQQANKSKKKVKKLSGQQISDGSEHLAIDLTNSLNNDQNRITKYHGHRPMSSDQSLDSSMQVNDSDLITESGFSSNLSQKVPEKLTKQEMDENRKKAIQNIKAVDNDIEIEVSISGDSYSNSDNNQKRTNKGKKKTIKRRSVTSQNDNNAKDSIKSNSNASASDMQLPRDFLAKQSKQPKRRDYFDRADIDNKRKPTKMQSNQSTDQNISEFSSLSDTKKVQSRNISAFDDDSFSTINSSSLLSTNSSINYKDDIDISQTPLPNEESFKQMQNNAILSIKSTNPPESTKSTNSRGSTKSTNSRLSTKSVNSRKSAKSANSRENSKSIKSHENTRSIDISDGIPSDIESTSANALTDSNLSQVQKSDFEEPESKAIKEIKEVNEYSLADVNPLSSTEPDTVEFTGVIEINASNSEEAGQSPQARSNTNSLEYLEEEEEEDVANDSVTHSQLNPTVDNLSDTNNDFVGAPGTKSNRNVKNTKNAPYEISVNEKVEIQGEQLNSSDQFFNSELTDDQAVREVKTKVDELVVPESTRNYRADGVRRRPKEDDTEAVFGTLSLPEKNDELQFDSEISDIDVELNTDKMKFKKSIVSRTPTNRIPSSIPSNDPRRIKKNNYEDDSQIDYHQISEFSSFLSSNLSDVQVSRDVNIDLLQEESSMFPQQFDIQQADSDDDGTIFEQFKRNANFLSSSSSDEQDPQPTPLKTRTTPNNSVTEVVENTFTEIDSISGSSGNSKRHKDKTVTKGRITLYNLSSSSSYDELGDDIGLDVQERGIKDQFSIDNDDIINDNTNKQRNEKLSSKPISNDRSSKTQNCYFDGNVVLKLTVVEAMDLPQDESIPLDPYCTVALSDKKKTQRTKTIRSSTRPIWDKQFIFNYNINKFANQSNPPSTPIFRSLLKQTGIFLYIQVFNEDKFGGDREISSAQLDLKDIKMSQYIDQWVKLKPSGNFRTGGKIRLNLFVEPQTPISSFSPRKTKIHNNDEEDNYLISPRSQTPSAHYNPFEEPVIKQQQNSNKTRFNSNVNQKSVQQSSLNQKSQTPNYTQRPWTDSYSESSVVESLKSKQEEEEEEEAPPPQQIHNQNQNGTVTLTLAEEEEEEEEDYYNTLDDEIENDEEQNEFHTEIRPDRHISSKHNSEKGEDNADNDLLASQDDSEDLSPIERGSRDNDEDKNSINSLNELHVEYTKSRNVDEIHQENHEEEELYDESPSLNDNDELEEEEENENSKSPLSSTSSGNVDI